MMPRGLNEPKRIPSHSGGGYATDLSALEAGNIDVAGIEVRPVTQATADPYRTGARGFGGVLLWIRQNGKTWLTR
jgi:hypothetical protein